MLRLFWLCRVSFHNWFHFYMVWFHVKLIWFHFYMVWFHFYFLWFHFTLLSTHFLLSSIRFRTLMIHLPPNIETLISPKKKKATISAAFQFVIYYFTINTGQSTRFATLWLTLPRIKVCRLFNPLLPTTTPSIALELA